MFLIDVMPRCSSAADWSMVKAKKGTTDATTAAMNIRVNAAKGICESLTRCFKKRH
jgi:hypothetical protein